MSLSSLPFFIFSFALFFTFSFQSQAHENEFSKIRIDRRENQWKQVLFSEGLLPQEQMQNWMVVEFPVQANGKPDSRYLPKLIFKKKMSLNGDPAEIDKIFSLAAQGSNKEKTLAVSQNPLWPLKKDHWDESDEELYKTWIEANATTSILVGSGVRADCADYALALRWIFSFENGLPAAQTLAGSGQLFGAWNSTSDWDLLPTNIDWKKNEKFKAALRYLFNATYTHSLQGDLYPIKIDREFVSPGAIYLTLAGGSGHTRTITHLGHHEICDHLSCIAVVWGNEPESENGYISDCHPYFVNENQGGFLRFRWPELIEGQWRLRPAQEMPGYSKEQFTWDEVNYEVNLNSGIALWASLEEQGMTIAISLYRALQIRQVLVDYGFYYCSVVPCNPQGPYYNEFSTPVRDQSIRSFLATARGFIKSQPSNSDVVKKMNSYLQQPLYQLAESLTLYDFISDEAWSKVSSDPLQDVFARWNFSPADEKEKIRILTQVLFNNWYQRLNTVLLAQAYCYKYGANQPITCDPDDPKIKILNTSRFDFAFRMQKQEIARRIQSLPLEDQNQLRLDIGKLNCWDEPCDVWSWIIEPGKLDKMTSSPTDTYNHRMGID